MAKAIEIFKAGTHVAMNGERIAFTEKDLQASAGAYDPALHEAPLCVGHPAHDMPAYGWVSKLAFGEGSLAAEPDQIDPQFAEMVRGGRFKKISAAFYPPDAPNNPKPGVYYLRHVAFLGAQPPAVKGLKPVEFADDDGVVVFGDWSDRTMVRLLRGVRDLFIEKFGTDAADKALPPDDLNYVADDAAQPNREDLMSQPNFAEQAAKLAEQQKTLDERAAAITKQEAELKTKGAEFSERDRAAKLAAHTAFITGLVKAGKVLPVHAPTLIAFMERVDGSAVIEFGEGDKKTTKQPIEAFKDFLTTLDKRVTFGEAAALPQAGDLTSARGVNVPRGALVDQSRLELHGRALAYAEQHKVDYATAAIAVERMG